MKKKLGKKVQVVEETLEAYFGCECSCSCNVVGGDDTELWNSVNASDEPRTKNW